jgi:hypothetical protein
MRARRGRSGRIVASRVRGCSFVVASRLSTIAKGSNGRMEGSAISGAWWATAASRGFLAERHRWCRHGLSVRWLKPWRHRFVQDALDQPLGHQRPCDLGTDDAFGQHSCGPSRRRALALGAPPARAPGPQGAAAAITPRACGGRGDAAPLGSPRKWPRQPSLY